MPKRLGLILILLCGFLSSVASAASPTVTAFQRGLAAYNRQDYATALREWQPLAQQGNPAAQTNLGYMYRTGRGVAQNDAEAMKWYRKAADQGDAQGQFNLGMMYERGRGVAQNDAEAVKWFRKAADQGHASGQYNLGVMYEDGRGVAQNDAEAVKWYRKAADQGNAQGQTQLARMYERGRGVAQNDAEAVKWYRKAADQGDAQGQFNLGIMYADGRGGAQDLAAAQRWFAKAVEAYPPGTERDNAVQARDRVAHQRAAARAPTPPPTPATPAVTSPTLSVPSTPPVSPTSSGQSRRALVIGNSRYPGSPLANPSHDANAMATFLAQEAGFTVYKGRALLDTDRQTLVSAIGDFAESIRRGDTVVFYFAGHGLERNGQNYLIPINFAAQNAAQLPYEAPTAQDIQQQLVASEPDMLMLILDACRDLPERFRSLRGRSGGGGLGSMSAVAGSAVQQVIMFATAPGTTASDGDTLGNGTFTYCFLQAFRRPGVDSRIAFGDVVQCVLDTSNREQNPFLLTSQRQQFVFK